MLFCFKYACLKDSAIDTLICHRHIDIKIPVSKSSAFYVEGLCNRHIDMKMPVFKSSVFIIDY